MATELDTLTLKPDQLVGALVRAARATIPAMVWGSPGISKTALVYDELSPALELPVLDFRGSSKEPVDFRGLPVIDVKNDITRWVIPEDLPRIPMIMFLDEINCCSLSVFACYYSILHERRLGNWTAPEGTVFVAAGNREKDRAIANKMPSALLTRMTHFTLEPDYDQWCCWGAKTGRIDPEFIGFIRHFPQHFNAFEPSAVTSPIPRTWEAANKIWRQNPPESTAHHEIAGCVGAGVATEFLAFTRLWEKIPSLDQIFRNPSVVPVPKGKDSMSIRFATAAAISNKLAPANFANGMEYLTMLGEEFAVFGLKDAMARDPQVHFDPKTGKASEAFRKWGTKNADLLG